MTNEEKILNRLLKTLNESDETTIKNKLTKHLSFILAFSLILTSILLIPKGLVIGKVAVVCGVFGGAIIYFWSCYSIGIENKKYLKQYINKKKIEERLNEIKT